MTEYKTPNVYVEEISTLPPSVAGVGTAIPAFVGYTAKAQKGDADLTNVPTRISTFLEYTELFGGPKMSSFEVTVSEDAKTKLQSINSVSTPSLANLMYHSVRIFFDNGGGPCYIVSVGADTATKKKADFTKGLGELAKEDEPTLIVLTDATTLNADYYELCKEALAQCNVQQDRFVILDVLDGDGDGSTFRNNVSSDYLKYGAAYCPYLQTSLNFHTNDDSVTVKGLGAGATNVFVTEPASLKITYLGAGSITAASIIFQGGGAGIDVDVDAKTLTISCANSGSDASTIVNKWNGLNADEKALFKVEEAEDSKVNDDTVAKAAPGPSGGATLASIKNTKTALYNAIQTEIAKKRAILPPSAAVAGVYARVDRDRGVWKAPANVSLNSVTGPTVKITNADQDNLNVDATAGKSINAIRAFTGKGTLVWGARTLAGNDNEWRYVPVRRLFIYIEESIQKASSWVVFEPNIAITWLKVRTMIESFLENLWRQGALAGSKPEEAFFVNVGLGKSMTPQDILEGRMIIEVGVAAVRPAEFIILRFSHKLQE